MMRRRDNDEAPDPRDVVPLPDGDGVTRVLAVPEEPAAETIGTQDEDNGADGTPPADRRLTGG